MRVSQVEYEARRDAGADKQLTEHRSDPGSPQVSQTRMTATPADGPIQSSRNYNIAISLIIIVDAFVDCYMNYAFETSDRTRRLVDLGLGVDDLLGLQNIQVLLGGVLLLGGNLTFVKVYLFRDASYWEGAGNLFEYVFSVQSFLEAVGIAVPESIGRLSKPATRLAQSSFCPCVQTNSDSPDDSMEEEDEQADPYVWTIWGNVVILTAIVQSIISFLADEPTRNRPGPDFTDWSTGGVACANFQVVFAVILVIDVIISIYESLAPNVATYFHDGGNLFELLIATRTLLASGNIKVPPGVGLLVKPITKLIWRFSQVHPREEDRTAEKVLSVDHTPSGIVALDYTSEGPVAAFTSPRKAPSETSGTPVALDKAPGPRFEGDQDFEFAV